MRPTTKQSSKSRRYRFSFTFLILSLLGIFGTNYLIAKVDNDSYYSRILLLDDKYVVEAAANNDSPTTINIYAATTDNSNDNNNNDNNVVHVLYGLSGNETGFLNEFEISLKSVLLNAPIDHDMTIHIIADEPAAEALPNIFSSNKTNIISWYTRNQITIQVYTILPTKLKVWERIINEKYDATATDDSSDDDRAWGKHTIGCYFRLFIHDVLQTLSSNSNKKNISPEVEGGGLIQDVGNEVVVKRYRNLNTNDDNVAILDVDHIIYLDVDVIMMSNIDDIWYHRNSDVVFQWGEKQSSGFILLTVSKLQQLWNSINSTNVIEYSKLWNKHERPGDQLLLRVYNITYPRHVGNIPKEYDVPLAHNLWKSNSLSKYRSTGIGNLHFSGSPNPKQSVYESHDILKNPKHKSGWGLANYYINLPWPYAKFISSSMIRKKKNEQQRGETGRKQKKQQQRLLLRREGTGDNSEEEESTFGYPLKIVYNTIV